jgi:2-oxoglutarate dehydrogenase E1 component
MAADYRFTFSSDVVIDLIGYRRHGHSEVDDPTVTQPRRYRVIKGHPPLWQSYAATIGADVAARRKQIVAEFTEAQTAAAAMTERPSLSKVPAFWAPYVGGWYSPDFEVDTGIAEGEIRSLSDALTSYPADFNIHKKVKRLLEQRREMGYGKRPVDFGMAEALALGSLLRQGLPVRLTGQDSRRGTFSQRHSVLIDTETEGEYMPLAHVAPDQARCEVYNSTLSEAGVLGFEYGYSRDYPETLVLWEAQFGDFVNGAQIIIDQFIAAGEDKWDHLSGLVLLLPHGYEGQGPEHSSARIERFMQLAAEHNMEICQPSTAAQYFHLLRRQALRSWRTPLVVFTPKSMLRHPEASSAAADLSRPRFLTVIPEPQVRNAQRVLVCTGKIGHELRRERGKRGDDTTAVVFVEQLYPFPERELGEELARHADAREIVWVQEEPANKGALFYVLPRLRRIAAPRSVRSIRRSASASPATGSAAAHALEQSTLISLAFSPRTSGKRDRRPS